MDGAYVDPQKLRDFALSLKILAGFVEERVRELDGRLGRLGQSWRDQEFQKFRDQMRAARRRLSMFAEETKKVAPMLERDAQAAEAYQRIKS